MAQSDLMVVDAHTLISEPWDLWTSRSPTRYRDRVPHVREVAGLTWDEIVDLKLRNVVA